MSRFLNSFKRELGKNSGKWLSNRVFGDGHATPYKVIVQREQHKLEDKKLKLQSKKIINNQIDNFIQRRDDLLGKLLPNNKNELYDFGLQLITVVNSTGWSSSNNEEDKYQNDFADANLYKLIQVKSKLQALNAIQEVGLIEKEIKSLQRKKMVEKYLLYVGMIGLGITFAILYKLGVIK